MGTIITVITIASIINIGVCSYKLIHLISKSHAKNN